VTSSSETEWTTVGGAPDCTLAMVGPTDSICPGFQQPDPAWCSNGIQNPKNSPHVCCALTCGKCGGGGCGSREGGELQCCHTKIKDKCTTRTQTGCVVENNK
jgi:hypothetical protein